MKITDELFEQYKNFVPCLYHKLEKTPFVINNREDLIQEGYLALLKGIESYEEYRTVSLSTYIFHNIKYAMYRYIRENSEAYSWTYEDLNDSAYKFLDESQSLNDNPEEFVRILLKDYEYYLTHHKKKHTNKKIDLWLCRAQIILEEFLNNGKVSTREIEEKYYFSRTNVSIVLKDLRNVIIMKNNNTLY